jgi:hypothetical protein
MRYINILGLSIFRIACVRAMSKVMVSLILVAVALALANPVMAGGNKVDVCHIPPGNPENVHTITISDKALDAHIAHGDIVGSCNANCATLCDDGDACTVDDTGDCEQNGCPAPTPVDCDDGNLCTTNSCNPASGCENPPVVCEEGGVCDAGTGMCTTGVTCPCWDGTDGSATSLQAFWTDNTPLPCTYDACAAETSTNGTSTKTEHEAGCDAPTNFPVGTLNQRWTESIVTMVITDTIEERSCETWVCYCEEDPSAKHDGCCISPKIELTLDQYEACASDHEAFTHMTVGAKPNVVEPCGLPTPGACDSGYTACGDDCCDDGTETCYVINGFICGPKGGDTGPPPSFP